MQYDKQQDMPVKAQVIILERLTMQQLSQSRQTPSTVSTSENLNKLRRLIKLLKSGKLIEWRKPLRLKARTTKFGEDSRRKSFGDRNRIFVPR